MCVWGGEKLGTILRVSLLRRSQPAVTDTPPPPLLLLMPPVGRNLGARHRQIERGREAERERERRARRQGLVSVSGRWSLGQQGGIEVSRGVVVKLGYDIK